MAETVLASGQPALEKLRTLFVELMKSYSEHYPLLYVYIRENLSHVESDRTEWSQHLRMISRNYEEAIIAIVQEGLDDGTIRPLASAQSHPTRSRRLLRADHDAMGEAARPPVGAGGGDELDFVVARRVDLGDLVREHQLHRVDRVLIVAGLARLRAAAQRSR